MAQFHLLAFIYIEKKDALPCNRDNHVILATSTKLLDIKSEVYRPGGDLVETNN